MYLRLISFDCICPPLCKIFTKKGTTLCCLIKSQLDGVADIPRNCIDILSMSLQPRSETIESVLLPILSFVEFSNDEEGCTLKYK